MKRYKIKYYQLKIAESEIKVHNPDTIFENLKNDFNPLQEEMYLFCLNVKNKIMLKKKISIGNLNTLMMTPKDIFYHIFLTASNSFVLAHNHPSGDITPSREDIEFTEKIKKAAEIMQINFLDHIIFTDKEFNSLRSKGIL